MGCCLRLRAFPGPLSRLAKHDLSSQFSGGPGEPANGGSPGRGIVRQTTGVQANHFIGKILHNRDPVHVRTHTRMLRSTHCPA